MARSIVFYQEVAGASLRARWSTGAYLELGSLWLCLAEGTVRPRDDYTHIALSAEPGTFDTVAARITARATIWQADRSEGRSVYFLDPDGHRLELHDGDLESRLRHYRARPQCGVEVVEATPQEG